ncbi:flagellar filament capping protein FliD [Rariglobus hedericola]|uniref:Flagellar hook-associated protein 2 n=1 Tax=Rariglobus hedericola TaxID=2597822 RepID=A0A556QPM0_9BACT|nr:flagellar filament capping protein FliD [Rariglobus hedericola]TSJ78581.1 flagellar hook protein [Rariglobus hedericola]
MATNQLSGLVSGFDWKTFIDSTIEYSSAPITRLQSEQSKNSSKSNALSTLDGKMTVLQSSINALTDSTSFYSRTAKLSSAATTWSAAAGTGTAIGDYKIAVTQLATASRLRGTTDIATGISASNDVSGITLSTMPLSAPVTAGTFTINGNQITIDLADSLQDVFDAISTATGGTVTGAYDSTTDKITLTGSGGPITLGAANDTSNFLSALRLANNGTATVASSSSLGALPQTTRLDAAGLRTPITAVDGSGNGSFTINGVEITYNTTTDSLKTVMARINASSAGVSASYDAATDRVSLINKTTGDSGIFISESSGGLLGALGLTASTVERGKNALYSINDGPELISATNTVTSGSHGIDGLSLTVGATGTDTVSVSGDTAAMKSKINAFISAFNSVQSFIEEQTKITSVNGKVTAATLSNEREVQSWSQTLRRNAFAGIDGLDSTISRLEGLGIDFTSGTNELTIKSQSTLDAALTNRPDDVAAFFSTSSTGFAARIKASVDLIAGTDFGKGYIDNQLTKITANNKSIDDQIAAIQRQLDQQRELLTASFIAMENAQQSYNNMQTQLTKAFSSTSSSS